jgi:DNA-binding NarL/FixJ family response regulator
LAPVPIRPARLPGHEPYRCHLRRLARGAHHHLTTFGRDEYVFQGIRAGAVGYMLKDAPADDLSQTIRRVHAGEVFIFSYRASRR